jgi:NHLM bacteriocin system ABC transporter peptidase/ATP-binding protein
MTALTIASAFFARRAPTVAPTANTAGGGPFRPGRCRGRTPTILQLEATECGAAGLAMILAYHGRWIPLEELRVACGVSRDGSKAHNMLAAARRYGLEAKGFKKEVEKVAELPFPMIVFWNFNHYVVVERLDLRRGFARLNDPAVGRRTVSLDEFEKAFTGVCLAFRTGPAFQRGGRPSRLIATLARRLTGSRSAFGFVLLATLGLAVPGIVIPAFSKIFIDQVLGASLDNWLRPLLIGMAATALMRGALTWVQQSVLVRLELKLAVAGSAEFMWHLLRLPVDFFNQRHAGDIAARVAAHTRIAQLLSGQLSTAMVGLATAGFYIAAMAAFDVTLTAACVFLALLNFAALKLAQNRLADASRRHLKEAGLLQATSIGGLQQIETLKSNGSESDFFARWAGTQANYLNAQQALTQSSTVLDLVPNLLAGLTVAVVLGLGGLRVIEGAMTVGGLVAFQSLLESFSAPIQSLVTLGGNLQTIKGDLNRIEDVSRYPGEPRLSATAAVVGAELAAVPKLGGLVELDHVTFGYNANEPPLIAEFSLTVRPGQRIAIVGGSGSGKSTVAKLLCGLYRPWSGRILFDGRPLAEIEHQVFANSVASVDQDIFLFEGSVRANVTMWDGTIDDAAIGRALRDAAILDVIEARPGGYDAPVAENGRNFSGGQRQRLEIARALAGEPSVLVLDEATSALDPQVERVIDDNLRRRGCTCLIVAHRLSTIRDCDEILVMEQGRVVQRGTHDEMIGHDGPYRRLLSAE